MKNLNFPTKAVFLSIILVLTTPFINAQMGVGLKVSVIVPMNKAAAQFKATTCYEAFYTRTQNQGVVNYRYGLFLAKYRPQSDTIFNPPSGYTEREYIVWKKFRPGGAYLDLGFRLFEVGNLSAYLGPGMLVGFAVSDYFVVEKSGNTSQFNGDIPFFSFRSRLGLQFDFHPRFCALLELTNSLGGGIEEGLVVPMSNNSISLGLCFNITRHEENKDNHRRGISEWVN